MVDYEITYICDRKACENCSYPTCRHTTDITHAKNFTKVSGSAKYMEKSEHARPIYLITVFDKCEPVSRWGYALGDTRSVGFRYSFELAEEVVKTNMCDIWEYCYDYACIEELTCELYPWANERWFYKYNRETGGYEEIDEPVFLKNHGPIGGIG